MVYARQKAKHIALLKYNIEEQKRYLNRSIKNITYQQESIKDDIDKNQDMIQRLRTDRGTYERAERELSRQSASLQSMISRRSHGGGAANITIVSGFIKPPAVELLHRSVGDVTQYLTVEVSTQVLISVVLITVTSAHQMQEELFMPAGTVDTEKSLFLTILVALTELLLQPYMRTCAKQA